MVLWLSVTPNCCSVLRSMASADNWFPDFQDMEDNFIKYTQMSDVWYSHSYTGTNKHLSVVRPGDQLQVSSFKVSDSERELNFVILITWMDRSRDENVAQWLQTFQNKRNCLRLSLTSSVMLCCSWLLEAVVQAWIVYISRLAGAGLLGWGWCRRGWGWWGKRGRRHHLFGALWQTGSLARCWCLW